MGCPGVGMGEPAHIPRMEANNPQCIAGTSTITWAHGHSNYHGKELSVGGRPEAPKLLHNEGQPCGLA